jgi:signal transduction histidine kinase
LVIGFTDNGPGISDADLPYVFDRFYRADKARNQEKGGHGLGLSIAKMIVEAHGGSISAGHAPEGGACIRIGLPLPDLRNGASHA